ncbi:MAG TPA: 5'-3' exonuclease H3TH domain-containing protein [Thermoanaerobaculia bacterium]
MLTIHLVDASPFLFRAFFSLPKTIIDRAGNPANAVYGFASFFAKYMTDEKPTHIGIAFDRHFNQSFRNQHYAPYKAQRDASPPELDAQVDPCVEMMEALGIATFIDEQFEADDLIATVIDQTRAKARHVIVTTDKDMTQLVSGRVTVYDPGRALRFDAAAVEAKFGVRPDQMTDFLGLAGDAVDNIPGVKGIGPKTAADLLRRYGSLEGIYQNVPSMKHNAVRANLERDVAMAGLSKRLATVSTEAPVKVDVDSLRYRAPDEERLKAFSEKFGHAVTRPPRAEGRP